MKKYLSLLLLANYIGILFCHGQKTYTLGFNPPDGSRYKVAMVTQNRMFQSVMDQTVETHMDYGIDAMYHITAEGAYKKLSIVYDRFNMDFQVMGQKISMSSEDTSTSNDANATLRALKGQSLSIILDRKGKVIRIEGADTIINQVSGAQQQETMKGILGEEALKNMIEQSFGYYPETPVKPGDQWTSTLSLKQPYSINGSVTYTLIKVEGPKAWISFAGNLKTDTTSSIKSNGIDINFDIDGDITGTTEVDIASGMPLSSTYHQKFKGNIEAQGQKMPMVVTTDITLTVSQKK